MFYITRTRSTEFDLVGPFTTLAEAERWSVEAQAAAGEPCTMAVFQADSEPVFCTIIDPHTREPRLGANLPDSVVLAIAGEQRP